MNNLTNLFISIIKNKRILILIFIVNPIISLPFIIYGIYNRKKYCFTLLSVLLGITGMLYAPNGDLFRYYEYYYSTTGINLSTLLFNLSSEFKTDYLLYFIQWLFNKLSIPNEIIVFLFITIGTNLIFKIFLYFTKNSKNDKTVFSIFLIIFLIFSYWEFYFRFWFSAIILIWGIFNIIIRKKRIGWVYLLLAPIIHFSTIIFSILFALSILLNLKPKKKLFIILEICTIFSIGLSSKIILNLLSYLPLSEILTYKIYAYTEGYWGNEWLNDRSIGILLIDYSKLILKFIILYILYKSYKSNTLYSLYTLILILIIILTPFATILLRFEVFFFYLSLLSVVPFLLANNNKNFKRNLTIFNLLFIIGISLTCGNFVMRRKILPYSKEKLLFYNPTLTLFRTHYDKNWLKRHQFLK